MWTQIYFKACELVPVLGFFGSWKFAPRAGATLKIALVAVEQLFFFVEKLQEGDVVLEVRRLELEIDPVGRFLIDLFVKDERLLYQCLVTIDSAIEIPSVEVY